jgi:phosphoribosylglycinamide formyltransferase-1
VGILISGRGSNMLALVRAMREGRIAAEPALVVSNVPGAPGLAAAEALGVPTEVLDSSRIKPRAEHEVRVIERLQAAGVELVCLAGYMRLLTRRMIDAFPGRILNVHPSLLPAFPGLDAQRQALEHGVKVAGCTVHVVDEQCDHGPIVLQAALAVLDDDTEQSLAGRILEQEHRLYVEAVRLFCEDRVRIEGRRVRVVAPTDP